MVKNKKEGESMMKMTRFMRLLIGMLAAVMLMGCLLTSCRNDPKPNTDNGGTSTEDDTTPEPEVDRFDALRNLNYSGEEFNVFTYQHTAWIQYFEAVEGGAQILNEATFDRNGVVEELFDIQIFIEPSADYAKVIEEFSLKALSGGSEIPDLVVPWATEPITSLLVGGYLTDVRTLDYMTLDADYYNQSVNQNFTFFGKQYAFVSDYTYPLQQRFAFLANTDIINEYRVLENLETDADSIYKLVSNGEWTWENLSLMIKDIYNDNGTTEDIKDDLYGLTTSYAHAAYVMNNWGDGINLVKPTDNGFTYSLYDLNMQDKFDDLCDLVKTSDVYLVDTLDFSHFKNSRAMFATYSSDPWSLTGETWQTLHFAYLPYPKYQAEDDYITTTHGGLMFIPAGAKDVEMAGAVSEALAISSNIYIYDAYISNYMEGRVIQVPEGVEMYDIMRETAFYGFTRYVDPSNLVKHYTYFQTPLKNNTALSTHYETNGGSIQRAFNALALMLQ